MLERVILKNCKTMKSLDLSVHKINCMVGKNGVGKSTLIKSLSFFYEALDDKKGMEDFDIFDKNNPYNNYIEIKVMYDFSYFNMIIENYKSKRTFEQIKESEFMKKLIELSKYVNNKNKLSLTLKMDSHKNKTWDPELSFDLRSILKTIYPFYFISLNNKKENNWTELWDMIEDLAAFSNLNNEIFLKEFFSENKLKEKFGNITKIIEGELNSSNIIIRHYKSKENFLRIVQLLLGGEELKFKYKEMSFFSEGTNSFNYLNIFCKLLNKISEQKLKIPTLFIDEPEVGLHPKYIDYLFSNILNEKNKYQVFLTTHSSRVLKNVVKKSKDHNIIHAIKKNGYTSISNVNNFLEETERLIFSDEEGTYYLSDKIIFVEGKTELELFNNNNIKKIFPEIENVEIYSYDADSQQLATIHPKVRNTKIPYLIVIDSDYIFTVENGKVKMKNGSKDYLNPLDSKKFESEHKKELFYFGNKREMLKIRQNIHHKSNTNIYNYHKYWFTIYGDQFIEHIDLIKKYCLYHDLYPVSTTIEGSLVNKRNVSYFKDWLISKNPYKKQQIIELYENLTDENVRATVFRLLVNGKYDNLYKFKKTGKKKKLCEKCGKEEPEVKVPKQIEKMENMISTFRGMHGKTSGWVTDFINFMFDEHIFKEETLEAKQKRFSYLFPELFDIISIISNK